MYLSRSEYGRGLIGLQDTVDTAILRLINYVRNSKERLLIATCTIEEDEDREMPREYKKRKNNERKKHSGHKNSCMDNWSDKQWVKQEKISEDG